MTATAEVTDLPYMRPAPTLTLREMANSYDSEIETIRIETGSEIQISKDRTEIVVKKKSTPVNEAALVALATWVDFPKAFFNRIDPDLQTAWLNELLSRSQDPGMVRIGKTSGIVNVLTPNQVPLSQDMIVKVAANVLSDKALVIETDITKTDFYLDAVVPLDDRSQKDLGDPKVGDISKAGLRFNFNHAQNLAPEVQSLVYRLRCTNGLVLPDYGAKLDARGQTVDEVLAELEAKARIAFEQVERDVKAMYDLRNEPVDNPERTINRMAAERRLSPRLRQRLIDGLPAMVPDPERVTMFDLVQVATHLANDPALRNRGSRTALQEFGGAIVSDHAERCGSCKSRLH